MCFHAQPPFEFHNTSTINEEVELTNYLFDLNNSLDKEDLISTQEGYKKLTRQRNNIVNKIELIFFVITEFI